MKALNSRILRPFLEDVVWAAGLAPTFDGRSPELIFEQLNEQLAGLSFAWKDKESYREMQVLLQRAQTALAAGREKEGIHALGDIVKILMGDGTLAGRAK